MANRSDRKVRVRARVLEKRWRQLCLAYLPLTDEDSIWRYHRVPQRDAPICGWKLHVSATILNATAILERIAPFLVARGVQFKAARSLTEAAKINSGLFHDYTQVGKIITVYPANTREAVAVADELHRLTYRFRAPSVPFDLRLTSTSNVYYRYGAFKHIALEAPGQTRRLGVISPDGKIVPDVREIPKPDWVTDNPFERFGRFKQKIPGTSGARPPFRVLRALVQRGKGGVYQAIDFSSRPARLCLLKEGRRLGEVGWDGRDGAWRVRHEEQVLHRLSRCGIAVPKVYAKFALQRNFYLVTEFVAGESLHNLLLRRRRRLPLGQIVSYGFQLADMLARMHGAGWGWRDCKPKNLIVTRRATLVPIDFEGAVSLKRPDPVAWSTRGFSSPGMINRPGNGVREDLYALGSILYLLLTGRVFDESNPIPASTLRKKIPTELCLLVELLLSQRSRRTLSAALVRDRLQLISLRTTESKAQTHPPRARAA